MCVTSRSWPSCPASSWLWSTHSWKSSTGRSAGAAHRCLLFLLLFASITFMSFFFFYLNVPPASSFWGRPQQCGPSLLSVFLSAMCHPNCAILGLQPFFSPMNSVVSPPCGNLMFVNTIMYLLLVLLKLRLACLCAIMSRSRLLKMNFPALTFLYASLHGLRPYNATVNSSAVSAWRFHFCYV